MPTAAAFGWLVLGRIAHDSFVVAQGARRSDYPLAHGRVHAIGKLRLFDSYHCSRLNTNTGVLMPEMFRDVIGKILANLDPKQMSGTG
jgi:uracil-DNA glycosylase